MLTPRDALVGAKTDLLKTIGNKIETREGREGKTSEDGREWPSNWCLTRYDLEETWCECQMTMPREGVPLINYFDRAKTTTLNTAFLFFQMVMLLQGASILWQFKETWSHSCVWKSAFKISVLCYEETTLGKVQSRERQNATRQKDYCFDSFSKVWCYSWITVLLDWNPHLTT